MAENEMLLSPLTLGTAQLGLNYGIANQKGQPDHQESMGILESAWNGGITCFDTARAYGDSERVLGHFFASRPGGVLITKISLISDIKKENIRSEIKKQAMESLSRLKINKIPILMLHHISITQAYWPEIIEGFRDCYREGLARYFGFSCNTDSESLQNAIKFADEPMIRYVQLPVHIADQRQILFETLSRFHARGIRVFARSVYLQGLFLLREEQVPSDLKMIIPFLRKLNDFSVETGLSKQQILVSYVRDMNGVDSLVIGAETAQQVQNNLFLINGPRIDSKYLNNIIGQMGIVDEYILNPFRWKYQASFNKSSK